MDSKACKSLIDRTVKYHQTNYHVKWKRLLDLYEGQHWQQVPSDQDRVKVNLAFAVVNVIVPAITHNYPRISVSPLKEADEDRATIAEAVINAKWKKIDAQAEVADATRDSLIFGTGITMTGWRRIEKSRLRHLSAVKDDYQKAIREQDSSGESERDLPSKQDVYDAVPTTEMAITHDSVFVERVSPFDFFPDPEATDTKDWKFVFRRIIKPLDSVKNNPRYDAKVRKGLKSDTSESLDHLAPEVRQHIQAEKRVTLFEFWDISNETLTIYAQGADEPLLGPVRFPYGRLPFDVLRNTVAPDKFWGIGELEQIESLVRELNKVRTLQINQTRQFRRKVVVREDCFLPQDLNALSSTEDGEIIPIRKVNVPIDQALREITPPSVDAQMFQTAEMIKGDISEITAISEYQKGQLPSIRRTATEASLIESASSIRSQAKLAQIEKLIASICKAILSLLAQYEAGEQEMRASGAGGEYRWFTYDGEDLDGDFHLEVAAGSTQPRNDSVRRAEATELYQTLAGNPAVDPKELTRYLLREYRIPNADRLLLPDPPPQQQEALPGDPSQPQPGPGAPPGAPPGQQPSEGGLPSDLDPAMLDQMLAAQQAQGGDAESQQAVPA